MPLTRIALQSPAGAARGQVKPLWPLSSPLSLTFPSSPVVFLLLLRETSWTVFASKLSWRHYEVKDPSVENSFLLSTAWSNWSPMFVVALERDDVVLISYCSIRQGLFWVLTITECPSRSFIVAIQQFAQLSGYWRLQSSHNHLPFMLHCSVWLPSWSRNGPLVCA